MFTVVAVVIGLVAGFATGGRLRNLGQRTFRSAGLLLLGVALQVLTEFAHLPKTADYLAVLVSYVLLAIFALRNLHLTGMGVVAIGLALNIVPIAVNHGMPVRASAIVEARIARPDELATLGFGGKRHLEGPADRVRVLGDILPDYLFHEVLSFGDLVMAAGIAAVFVHMLRPPRRTKVSGAAAHRGRPVPPPPPGASSPQAFATSKL